MRAGTNEPTPVAGLVADLRQLGVRPGETLMIHASLRRIGPVEGGVTGVLDALDAAVGPDGTLLMILGAAIDHEWVNERPEAERAGLLASAVPYDPLGTPALPEVGHLAEAFRIRPGTIVTDNPSGRFGARGRQADALLRNAPWHDYYGPDSPLQRFCDIGGRVLRLGANPDTTTVLHYAEYQAEMPVKRRVRRHYRVRGPAGPEVRPVECLDDEHGLVDWPDDPGVGWPDNDYFAVILQTYLATGRGARGRVGQADAQLLDAQDLVAFGARWMSDHLGSGACP